MVKIEHYIYGCITVNKRDYTDDIYITASGAVAARKHTLEARHREVAAEEIAFLLRDEPEVIVIGSGKQGLLEVPKESAAAAARAGVKLEIAPTRKAVNRFNWYAANKYRVAGLFHITE